MNRYRLNMFKRTFTDIVFVLVMFHISDCKPQTGEEQRGPCVGMDCLHGVLMHNDEDNSGDHKAEDQYLRFKGVLETGSEQAGPLDAEKVFHGALMHGDKEAGEHHEEKAGIMPEVAGKVPGPKDLNEVMHEAMHGEEGVGKHVWDKIEGEDAVQKGPEGDKMMHGMLMHGDANHAHHEEPATAEEGEGVKRGPIEGDELMHGILMHGDANGNHEHGGHEGADSGSEEGNMRGPDGDLHGILMHGDSEIGHDHTDEHAKDNIEPFRDITKLLEMELEESLLKIIDIEAIIALMEKDKKEYEEYVKSQPEGSTLASVSDSLWSNMELMKQKYLAGVNTDDVDSRSLTKDLPFSAEDARDALGEFDHHAEDGEDMRHNLELLGSTEPINARHKAMLELRKATLDDE